MSAIDRLKNLEYAARRVDKLTDNGREQLDSEPLAASLDFKQPETLQQMLQRMVRSHVSAIAQTEGYETLEESMDFDVEGADLPTDYEIDESLPIGNIDETTDNESGNSADNTTDGDTPSDFTPPEEKD